MLVASYSYFHGQTNTTANVMCPAVNAALRYNIKVLLAHSQQQKGSMESAFFTKEKMESLTSIYSDHGIDALERRSNANLLKREDFKKYCIEKVPKRLDILTGTTKISKEAFENERTVSSILNILCCAREAYDLVFVDVNSGVHSILTDKILDISDSVIINLNQNEKVLRDYFNSEIWHYDFKDKHKILVLGRYDPRSKYSVRYIKNTFNYEGEIYTIPYSVNFMDAHNDHQVIEFFMANSDCSKNDENYFFMKEVDKLANHILKLEKEENIKEQPLYTPKKGLIRKLRSKFV